MVENNIRNAVHHQGITAHLGPRHRIVVIGYGKVVAYILHVLTRGEEDRSSRKL